MENQSEIPVGSIVKFISKFNKVVTGELVDNNYSIGDSKVCVVLARPFEDGEVVRCLVKRESIKLKT